MWQNQSEQVVRLELNRAGRDFVVGDIHGHFELFDLLLKNIQFDSKVDRIISVGDTIDRGPESERAIDYWRQPWFYLVRGNHEAMLAGTMGFSSNMYGLWMQNGGEWSSNVPETTLHKMSAMIEQMPYAISVRTPLGEVGIVHADIPSHYNWMKLVKDLQKNKAKEKDLKILLWSRETFRKYRMALENGEFNKEPQVKGVHKVYIGHNVVRNPVLFGNMVFIDTGAYCNSMLTAVDLMSEDVIIVQPKRDIYQQV